MKEKEDNMKEVTIDMEDFKRKNSTTELILKSG